MQRKLSQWATEDPSKRFVDLYSLLCNEVGLRVAHHHVNSNQGRETAGIDGETMSNFNGNREGNLEELRQLLKAGTFEPVPVRRVHVPKPKGGERPLGIPMCPAYCLSLPQRLGMSIARTIAMRWRHQPTQYTGSGSTGTSPTMPGAPRTLSAARSSAVGAFHPPCAASPIAREQLRNNAPSPGHYFYFYTTKIISVFFYGSVEALRGPALGSWLPGVLPTGGGWPSPPEPSLYPGPMPRLPLADGLA